MRQSIKRLFFHLVVGISIGGILAGCATPGGDVDGDLKESKDPEKQLGQLRIYLETHEDGIRSQKVQVLRSAPFEVVVDRSPILTEAHLDDIKLVYTDFGYHIEIQADQRGTWLLESYTATNSGRKLVISAAFPEIIWLAAPIIRGRVSDGRFTFSPDASVEEANRLVLAIDNSIRKIKNRKKPKDSDGDGDGDSDKESGSDNSRDVSDFGRGNTSVGMRQN